MKKFTKSAAITLAALTFATATQAQDWTGPYAGLYVGSAYDGTEWMVGALGGYQYQMDSFVVGGEADAFYATTTGDYEIIAKLRAGFLPSDNFLIFATVGAGLYNATTTVYSLGVGAEVRMTDTLSLRGDFEAHDTTFGTITSGPKFFKLGTVWNF